jgi:hypothetical protein
MIRKSTYWLLVILLLLAAVVVFLQRTPGLKNDTDLMPTSTESPILMNLGGRTITAFAMTDDQGRLLKASLNDQKDWFIEQPSGCQYASDNLANSLSTIQTFKVLVSLEAPPALADVGLTRPTYQLILTFDDGTTQSLKVGSIVPTGSGYYVQVNYDPVVVVTKYSIDTLFGLVSTACATPTPEPNETPSPTLTQTEATPEVIQTAVP